MVRRPSVVRRPQCSKFFFSKPAWPIEAKFYVEPPRVGGTKVCSRHLGHMTKMAITHIYGKNPSSDFILDFGKLTFSLPLGIFFKINKIGKIKTIFGLGMTPL